MIQMVSQRPRSLVRTILCALLIAFVCQATVSVCSASAAGSGLPAIQGFGSYFLTLPYGGIKMTAAVLGTVAGGMGRLFIRGDKLMADKIWGPVMGGEYVTTPEHIRGEKDLHFFGQAQGK